MNGILMEISSTRDAYKKLITQISEIYKSRGDNKKAVHFLMLPHNWLLSMVEKPDMA